MVPLMLAIKTRLPSVFLFTICLATACAVIRTPVTLTPSIRSASSAVYSKAGVSC